jgi:hypothetical protein
MDVLREGSGGLPDDVGEGFFLKFQKMYPLPTDPPAVERFDVIVTTPSAWVNRPESSDPAWELCPNATPLVVATRLDR